MRIYWTLKSIPELDGLESSQRRKIWRACCLRPFRHWPAWVAFLSPFLLMSVGAIFGIWLDGETWILFGGASPELEKLRFPVATACLTLGSGLAASIIFGQVFSRIMRPYLRDYRETHNAA